MPPRLRIRGARPSSYFSDLFTLLDPRRPPPNSSRSALLRSILLRSVAVDISHDATIRLPLRLRPAMIAINILVLVVLGVLGFHAKSSHIPINDKLLHFFCFFLASLVFYLIFDFDPTRPRQAAPTSDSARTARLPPSTAPSPHWRYAPLILSIFVTIFVGAIGSEFVQALLPYKTFDPLDVVANLFGGSLGIALAMRIEKGNRIQRELRRLYAPLGAGEDDQDEEEGVGLFDSDDDDDAHFAARFEDDDNGDNDVPGRRQPFGEWQAGATPLAPRQTDVVAQQPAPHSNSSSGGVAKSQDLFSIEDDDDGGEGDGEGEDNVWKR